VLVAELHRSRVNRPLDGQGRRLRRIGPSFDADADHAPFDSQRFVRKVVQRIVLEATSVRRDGAGREDGVARNGSGGEEQLDFAFEQKNGLRVNQGPVRIPDPDLPLRPAL